jgi:hypothetical protein
MKTKIFAPVLLALAMPALAAAQQQPGNEPTSTHDRDRDRATPAMTERRFRADLRLNSLFFDNFFQTPEGSPQEDVKALAGELRLVAPLGETLEGYTNLNYTDYEDPLESSHGVTAGLRSAGRTHGFDLFGEYLTNRPSGDVGELVEQADIRRVAGEYSYRVTRDWQLIALGDYQQQDFDISQGKDNTFVDFGGSVRYRGFGAAFSPEIGATFGERDADDPDEDHDQRDLFLKIRSAPARWAYLSLRYRHRTRDYSIDDRLASNFGREDTRRQWVATADLRTGNVLTWNLYYSYEDAESTRLEREFTTSLFAAGLTVGLGELFGW